MSARMGPVSYHNRTRGEVFLGRDFSQNREYSETTAREIDEEVKKLLEISEKEAITRAAHGQLTICAACYDVRGKIVLVKYDTQKPKGILRDFCPDCVKAQQGCQTCGRRR